MISNLLLVTGNYMRPGAGAYPMRGHNNVQGASDFGTLPGFLPGYQLVEDDDVRQKFEAAWGTKLPPAEGKVSYERLEGYKSLLWPVHADGTDTPLLFTDGFPFPDGKARLVPVAFVPPLQATPEYDLLLNNGRLLEHFHEGNMTNKSRGLRHKFPGTFVEVSPELAKERGIETGTLVRLATEYGAIKVRALVTDRVSGRELFMPMNSVDEESAINNLTGPATDVLTNTPAYKQTYVRMEVLEQKGESPLPRANHRFGHRNPQRGVEVDRKWRRSDYQPITDAQAAAKAGEQHG